MSAQPPEKSQNISSDILRKVGILSIASILLLGLNIWINPKKYARVVEAQVMKKNDMQLKILATGLLGFKDFLQIKSELSERIVKKNVAEGDKVIAGDVLLILDSTKQKIAYEKELNRVKDIQGEVIKARNELIIQKDLFSKSAVARTSVEKAESDLSRAQTNFTLAKQEIAIQRKELEKTLIVSERSGIVLVDYVQRQTSVEQNKPLFEIGTPGQFQLNGKIDELNIQNVFEGARVEVRIDAFPNVVLPAVVTKIDSQAESGSFSKIGVKIDLEDTMGLNLRSNLTAQGHIFGNEIRGALWLPMEAIKTDGDKRYVFVIGSNNKVKKRMVVTNRTANNQAEITEGLSEGDTVAITDIDFLDENEYVKIAEPKSKS